MKPADSYERLALRGLLLELVAEQTAMARATIAAAGGPDAGGSTEAVDAAVQAWTGPRQAAADKARRTLEGIESEAGGWSFAKLSLAVAALRDIRASAA